MCKEQWEKTSPKNMIIKSSEKQTPPPLNCIKKCGLKEAKLSGRVLTKRECRNGGADLGEAIFDFWVEMLSMTKHNMISLSICLYNCHISDEQMRAKTKCNMMSHAIISCQDL